MAPMEAADWRRSPSLRSITRPMSSRAAHSRTLTDWGAQASKVSMASPMARAPAPGAVANGMSDGSNTSDDASAQARAMVFSSSRTLPGQRKWGRSLFLNVFPSFSGISKFNPVRRIPARRSSSEAIRLAALDHLNRRGAVKGGVGFLQPFGQLPGVLHEIVDASNRRPSSVNFLRAGSVAFTPLDQLATDRGE